MPRGIPNTGQRQTRRTGNKAGQQQQNMLSKGQLNQLGKFHGLVGNILQQHGWSGGASTSSGRGRAQRTGTRRNTRTTGTRQRKAAAAA